ncbi:MAG TPA: NTP transferase domain-containing protein [Actinocrinis sp.]|uniref:molybdenum cofactor guanylyltransferase n=1 Tax=Actinocrinis sp. TaxID=1920516 RepID=UPI002D6988D1|nr:NTP transferase domain-containing protein [Actinocrinis sp.]HZU56514.1 NTP transferase domain-containing protein [Actinocrinis sp.]
MDVLILAGGEARRLRGADKPMVEVGGRTLLDRVIAACATLTDAGVGGSGELVVVGPSRATEREVRWIREQPPGGGPVAAIAAGLAALAEVTEDPHDWIGVFAADLPFLTATAVHRLWTAVAASEPGYDGAVAVDAEGREQWLNAVYRREALESKLAEYGSGGVHGLPLRRLVRDLRLLRISQPGNAVLDCDTWEDVDAARRIADSATRPDRRSGAAEEGN